MMLDNANNLLTKRQEYFKAPIPVTKLSCSIEPINEEILRGLANSLGDVNEASKDTGKKLSIMGGGQPRPRLYSAGNYRTGHLPRRGLVDLTGSQISPITL